MVGREDTSAASEGGGGRKCEAIGDYQLLSVKEICTALLEERVRWEREEGGRRGSDKREREEGYSTAIMHLERAVHYVERSLGVSGANLQTWRSYIVN